MMNFFKDLFSNKGHEELKQQLESGALIIDVRSEEEFRGGHVQGSQNIPLNKLAGKLASIISKKKTVVCVCASGMRSAQATNFLTQNGVQAINGGSWHTVDNLIQA